MAGGIDGVVHGIWELYRVLGWVMSIEGFKGNIKWVETEVHTLVASQRDLKRGTTFRSTGNARRDPGISISVLVGHGSGGFRWSQTAGRNGNTGTV